MTFVARHDAEFAKDFLVRIGGVPRNELDHTFEIEPQADDCQDLLIHDLTSEQYYVVEFKVPVALELGESLIQDSLFGRSRS